MIKQTILIVLTALTILSCNSSDNNKMASQQSQTETKTQIDSILDELNNKFTINGKPINPRVIHDLTGGDFDMSDGPIITALDLKKANESNRYFCDSCLGKYDIYFGTDKDGNNLGHFAYKYLGKTANNIHVVQTSSNGGGSGSWSFVLFLSVQKRNAYVMGEKQEQLILNLEGSADGPSGSGLYGTNSKIAIKQNTVTIDYETNESDENGKEKITKNSKQFDFYS
jgi:hypothetical protein